MGWTVGIERGGAAWSVLISIDRGRDAMLSVENCVDPGIGEGWLNE